jgi:hypothetical protein
VDSGRTPLVSIPTSGPSTSENATSTPANSVEAAVREEIATLSGLRLGLVAAEQWLFPVNRFWAGVLR